MTFKAFKAEIQHICPTSLRYVSSAIKSVSFCSSLYHYVQILPVLADLVPGLLSGPQP